MNDALINKIDIFVRKMMVSSVIIISGIVCFLLYLFYNVELIKFVRYLERGSDSVNSMASVFTGIYFSLLILMLSIPSFSKIKQLGRKNYDSLIKILCLGLAWAFSYEVWQIILAFSSNELVLVINFNLMLGFLLSVVRTGLYFWFILQQDLKKSYKPEDKVSRDIQTIKRMMEEMERKEQLRNKFSDKK